MEETIYVVEEEEDEEETIRVSLTPERTNPWATDRSLLILLQTIHKKSEMLFVRGMFL